MLKVENSTVEKVQFKTLNALEHHNFILRNGISIQNCKNAAGHFFQKIFQQRLH